MYLLRVAGRCGPFCITAHAYAKATAEERGTYAAMHKRYHSTFPARGGGGTCCDVSRSPLSSRLAHTSCEIFGSSCPGVMSLPRNNRTSLHFAFYHPAFIKHCLHTGVARNPRVPFATSRPSRLMSAHRFRVMHFHLKLM
jgi:hypothetical protein